MSYRSLPHIEVGARVTPETARQDRMELTIRGLTYSGQYSAVRQAASLMAEEVNVGRQGHEHRVFTAVDASRRADARVRLEYAARDGQRVDHVRSFGGPLERGEITFRLAPRMGPLEEWDTNRDRPYGLDRFNVMARLNLNLTRALNHQNPIETFNTRNEPRVSYPTPTHFTSYDASHYHDEYTLDRNDNVALPRRHHAISQPPHWHAFRERYLTGVGDLLFDRLYRAFMAVSDIENTGLDHSPIYDLHYVENYWEFQHDDPVHFLDDLRPYVYPLSRRGGRYRYRYETFREGYEANAYGYRIDLASGVQLSLYAKTNRRIRLEIRHRLGDVPPSRGEGGLLNDRNTPSFDALFDLMDRVAIDAADHANRVLEAIELSFGADEEQADPFDLVLEITQAVERELEDEPSGIAKRQRVRNTQRMILARLIRHNRYVIIQNDPRQPIIERLTRRGVLVTTARGVRRLANKYLEARMQLIRQRPEYDDLEER